MTIMEILLLSCTFLFALLASRDLPRAMLLVLVLLPSYLLRADFFGIPITLLELMLFVTVGVWLWNNRTRLSELVVMKKDWSIALALFVLSATISAIIAPNVFQALGIWKAYFLEPILFFYVLKDVLLQSKLHPQQVIRALLVGGVWVSLVGLIQFVTHAGIPIPWDYERRITGVFDYPNALGLYLGPLAVLACVSALQQWNLLRKDAMIYLGCFILFVLTIVLAQSEASLVALGATVIIMSFFQPRWRKKTLLIVAVLALLGFALPITRSYLLEKITFQDASEQIRLIQWSETMDLLKDHPIVGAGLSGYPTALVPYHQASYIEIFQYPHNVFLNIWVELGLLGLLTFFSFLVILVRPMFSQPSSFLPMLFALLPLLQMFLHGLVDVPYFKNDLALLTWTLLALVYVQTLVIQKKHY